MIALLQFLSQLSRAPWPEHAAEHAAEERERRGRGRRHRVGLGSARDRRDPTVHHRAGRLPLRVQHLPVGVLAAHDSRAGGGARQRRSALGSTTRALPSRAQDAIGVLSAKLLEFPTSRAALSLIAYCYYYCSDFQNALTHYER